MIVGFFLGIAFSWSVGALIAIFYEDEIRGL